MVKTNMVRFSDTELRVLKKARDELRRNGYAGLKDLDEVLDEEGGSTDLGGMLATLALGAIAAVGAAAIIKMLADAAQNRGRTP
jgi:hypothetical protein